MNGNRCWRMCHESKRIFTGRFTPYKMLQLNMQRF